MIHYTYSHIIIIVKWVGLDLASLIALDRRKFYLVRQKLLKLKENVHMGEALQSFLTVLLFTFFLQWI